MMAAFQPLAIFSKSTRALGASLRVDCRGLRIYPSAPPPDITLPARPKLAVLPKVPSEFANSFVGKLPRGTKEHFRMRGEEMVHTDLLIGQFAIIAVHGGAIKLSTFDTIRNYLGRKMNKQGNCFAFFRVDPPYKVQSYTYRIKLCLLESVFSNKAPFSSLSLLMVRAKSLVEAKAQFNTIPLQSEQVE